jgi:predicted nicotinamide N-methyase
MTALTNDIVAHYQVETFSYYPNETDTLDVMIRSATTTVGSNLCSPKNDFTGIMVWPATHLMCQYICSSPVLGESILELGCGCGVLGVTAALSHPLGMWVSTDMDQHSLNMCRENYKLNACKGIVRKLQWASQQDIRQLQQELSHETSKTEFDAIVGADIIYPSTCGQGLRDLFETVKILLSQEGTLYLSFCTRDGHRTPRHLIEAASNAGFCISSLPPLDPQVKKKLPPLLDATLLVLKRSKNAYRQNKELGGDDCIVCPGLMAAIARAEEISSEEEWEAPFDGESDCD